MKDRIRKDTKRALSKETVEIVGYICWGIGIFSMILGTRCPGLTILGVPLFAFGIAVFGIGTGFIGLGVARKSGKRMTAMANLEFHEKVAVVENYIADVKAKKPVVAKSIKHDLIAAKQLDRYVDDKIKNELDSKINELKVEASKKPRKYKDLIDELSNFQEDNPSKHSN